MLPKMPKPLKVLLPKPLPKYDPWGKKRPWMYKFVQRWCNKYNIDWFVLAKIDGYDIENMSKEDIDKLQMVD